MPEFPPEAIRAARSAIGTHMIVDVTAEPDVICHGTVYTGSADGWTEIGHTEGGTFDFAPAPGLAGEFPFARLEGLSMTITVPLTAAGLRMMHVVHGGRGSIRRCLWCSPRGNPAPLAIDGERHRRPPLASN